LEPGATFTLTDEAVIAGHDKRYGGAVYVSSGATFTMDGGLISDCKARYGGAIYVEGAESYYDENENGAYDVGEEFVDKNGNGIYDEVGGELIIKSGEIKNCQAENGFAIYLEEGAKIVSSVGSAVAKMKYSDTVEETNFNSVISRLKNIVSTETNDENANTKIETPYDYTFNYIVDGRTELITDLSQTDINNRKVRFVEESDDLKSLGISNEMCMGWFNNENIEGFLTKPVEDGDYVTLNSNGDVFFQTKKAKVDDFIFNHDTSTDTYSIKVQAGVTGEVVIPKEFDDKKITAIQSNAFIDAPMVTAIHMPSSITTIATDALKDLDSMQIMYIGKNVSVLEGCGLASCDNLKTIIVDEDNPVYTSRVDGSVLEVDAVPATFKSATTTNSIKSIETNAIIKKTTNSVVAGCYNSFKFNYFDIGVLNQEIPKTVTASETTEEPMLIVNAISEIADNAFLNCTNLVGVNITKEIVLLNYKINEGENIPVEVKIEGEGLTKIGANAFKGCINLESFSCEFADDSSASIGESAFNNLDKLTNVTFTGKSTVKILGNAFHSCDNLQDVTFSTKVTTINNGAFKSCVKMNFTTNIFDNVTIVGSSAFENCYSLSNVDFSNNEVLISIGVSSFQNTAVSELDLSNNNVLEMLSFNAFKQDSTYTIDGVTIDNKDKLKMIYIPASVTTYGVNATTNKSPFDGCTNLQRIVIKTPVVTAFDKDNYGGCANLQELEIPCNVSSDVNGGDLEGLQYLEYVKLNPSAVIVLPSEAFKDCVKLRVFECTNTIKSMGYQAFYNTRISKVIIDTETTKLSSEENGLVIKPEEPDDVKSFNNAFQMCNFLTDVYYNVSFYIMPTGMFDGYNHVCDTSVCADDCDINLSITIKDTYYIADDTFNNLNIKSLTIENAGVYNSSDQYSGLLSSNAFKDITCKDLIIKSCNNINMYAFQRITCDNIEIDKCKEIKPYSFNNITCNNSFSLNTFTGIKSVVINESIVDVMPAIRGTINNLYFKGKVCEDNGTALIETDAITATIENLHIDNFENWCTASFVCAQIVESSDGETHHIQGYTPMFYAKNVFINKNNSPSTTFNHPINVVKSHTYQGVGVGKIFLPSTISKIEAAAFECENLEYIVFAGCSALELFGWCGNGIIHYSNHYWEDPDYYHCAPGIYGSPFTRLSSTNCYLVSNALVCTGEACNKANCLKCKMNLAISTNTNATNVDSILDLQTKNIDANTGKTYFSFPNNQTFNSQIINGNSWVSDQGDLWEIYDDGSGVATISNNVLRLYNSVFVNSAYRQDISAYVFYDYKTQFKIINVEDRTEDLLLSLPLNSLEVFYIAGDKVQQKGFDVDFNLKTTINLGWYGNSQTYTAENLKYVFISKYAKPKNYTYSDSSLNDYSFEGIPVDAIVYTDDSQRIGTAVYPGSSVTYQYMEQEAFYNSYVANSAYPEFIFNGTVITGVVPSFMKVKTEITIPSFVTGISDNAFNDVSCENITKVTIQSGALTKISTNTFTGLTNLKRIYVPSNVTTIPQSAFSGNSKLARIYTDNSSKPTNWAKTTWTISGQTVKGSVVYGSSIDYFKRITCSTELSNDARFDFENSTIIKYFGTETDLVLPNGVTEIEDSVFENNAVIKTLFINKELKKIGDSAFYNCSNLEIVTFKQESDASLYSIGDYAFQKCYKLEFVYFAERSYMSFGESPFLNGSGYSYLRIFFGSSNKQSSWNSFFNPYSTYSTTRKLDVYYGVTLEDFNFIIDCEFMQINADSGTYYPSIAKYNGQKSNVIIPKIFKGIGIGAFKNNVNLTALDLGEGVQYVAPLAFNGCENLLKVWIPKNVKHLDTQEYEIIKDAEGKLVVSVGVGVLAYVLTDSLTIAFFAALATAMLADSSFILSPFVGVNENVKFYVEAKSEGLNCDGSWSDYYNGKQYTYKYEPYWNSLTPVFAVISADDLDKLIDAFVEAANIVVDTAKKIVSKAVEVGEWAQDVWDQITWW